MLSLAPLVLSPNSRGPKPLLLTCQRSFTQRCFRTWRMQRASSLARGKRGCPSRFYLYPGYRAPKKAASPLFSAWRYYAPASLCGPDGGAALPLSLLPAVLKALKCEKAADFM